jgi:two-component system LytT family response regulator
MNRLQFRALFIGALSVIACHFAVIGVVYTVIVAVCEEEACRLKVVIIDDEKAMHLIMKRMLVKVDQIEIVGSFHETTAAFSYVVNHDVDLIFLDIRMPRENGLEFANRLRESGRRMKLVFVTSYKEYAPAAFDVYAYDYIVKPVKQDRLHKTVQRVLSERQNYQ